MLTASERFWRNRKDKEYRQQRKDFQAALAAADAAGYEAGLRARWGEREDRAWNAALDAVLRAFDCWYGHGQSTMDLHDAIAALRKTPPQEKK